MAFGGEDGGGITVNSGVYRNPPPTKQPSLWEYKLTTLTDNKSIPSLQKAVVKHLEEEGVDGWECISHSACHSNGYSNGHNMFVWKRFKQM